MRWLGIDSSLAAFGWCLVDLGPHGSGIVRDAGCIITKPSESATKAEDVQRRMEAIGNQVNALMSLERPNFVAIESVVVMHGNSSAVTQSRLGRIFGVVHGLALAHRLPLHEVGAQELKLRLTGNRSAEKHEVLRAMLGHWPTLAEPLERVEKAARDNVTDAAAVAWCFEWLAKAKAEGRAA